MPISSAALFAANLAPEGYTQDAQLVLGADAIEFNFSVDIPVGSIPDADPAVALTDLATAIKSWYDSDYAINTLGLDATFTNEANINVTSYALVNRATSDLQPQDVVYRVSGTISHERTA